MATRYKITVTVPNDHCDILMDAIDDVVGEAYPGYKRAFTITDVKGTWIPTESAKPFVGKPNVISSVEEKKLEFIVPLNKLRDTLMIIDLFHPYEQPAVDVIPTEDWRSYLD